MSSIAVRTADRYPTRDDVKSYRSRREDPVVWPGADSGPVGPEDLAAHDQKGFHLVEGLLSPAEVAEHRGELQRLSADAGVRADERTVVEQGSQEVRSIFEVHRTSPLIARLVSDPRLVDRAKQLLGSEVYVHQSRINYMPGFRGGGFYWHSDFETWHAEDGMPVPRAVSVSIALTGNYPFNGGLMLLPGAHRTFVRCAGRTPRDNYKSSLQQQRVGVPAEDDITELAHEHGIEQFTGAAGSALWFDANTMHGSGNNITPFPRSNIFVVFNSVHNALERPFAADEPRPEFIASRDFTPVRR